MGIAGTIFVIAVWAATGSFFHYSDTWQLIINTGTTIITFLMVFIIQNTQNRDAKAINLKLDELIHSIDAAGNQMLDIEKLSDEELDVLQAKYQQLRLDCVEKEGMDTGYANLNRRDPNRDEQQYVFACLYVFLTNCFECE
jgi:low affinity Fe/Cu permease